MKHLHKRLEEMEERVVLQASKLFPKGMSRRKKFCFGVHSPKKRVQNASRLPPGLREFYEECDGFWISWKGEFDGFSTSGKRLSPVRRFCGIRRYSTTLSRATPGTLSGIIRMTQESTNGCVLCWFSTTWASKTSFCSTLPKKTRQDCCSTYREIVFMT